MPLTLEISDDQITQIARKGHAVMEDRGAYSLEQVKTAFVASFPVLFDSLLSTADSEIGVPAPYRSRTFNEALGLSGVGETILSAWESE